MKVLWRSDPLDNEIGSEVRLLDLDGEIVFELALPVKLSFVDRVKAVFKYLFGSSDIKTSVVLTDGEFIRMCREVLNGREDGKDKGPLFT